MALFEGRREGREDISDVSLIGLFDLKFLNWSTAPSVISAFVLYPYSRLSFRSISSDVVVEEKRGVNEMDRLLKVVHESPLNYMRRYFSDVHDLPSRSLFGGEHELSPGPLRRLSGARFNKPTLISRIEDRRWAEWKGSEYGRYVQTRRNLPIRSLTLPVASTQTNTVYHPRVRDQLACSRKL